MNRLFPLLLATLTFAAVAYIGATAGDLPPRVATHFGAGGHANGWMTREGYTAFVVALAVGLPWLAYAAMAWMPARWPGFVNLPHRDHWFSPRQREATLATLRRSGAWLAVWMLLFAVGMHIAILAANQETPAHLHEPAFIAGVIAFVVAVIGVVIFLLRHFGRSVR